MVDPLQFITAIRESFFGAELIYTRGSCYQFYKILKVVFPNAVAYYDSNHVITRICNKYYDITGEVKIGRHLMMERHYPDSIVKQCKFDIFDVINFTK